MSELCAWGSRRFDVFCLFFEAVSNHGPVNALLSLTAIATHEIQGLEGCAVMNAIRINFSDELLEWRRVSQKKSQHHLLLLNYFCLLPHFTFDSLKKNMPWVFLQFHMHLVRLSNKSDI